MEIEPMRAIGVALDKATLQQTLYSLGIDRTFDSLTRAQKTELLYYQIMTQTSKMQGELGRTMTSPANMARIMKQEFTQLGRAIGSIFIPIAMKIIPVVRAVVQILTEAAKAIASFFGFKIGNYTSEYSAGLEDISVGLDDIENSATGAAKAMNKMLMPFDELNNINFNSGSGGGSGIGGVGGGGSLFDTLPEYNIFDSIVGNIDKDVERIKAKIESMLPVFKVLGVALAAAFAITKLAQFIEWINRIHKALSLLGPLGGVIEMGLGLLLTIGGIWTQWQGTKKLLNGDYSIWAVLETIGGTALGTFGIVSILKGIQKMGGLKTLSTGNMIGIGLGVMLLIQSFQVLLDAAKTGDAKKIITGIVEAGLGLGALTWGANAAFASKVIILSLSIQTITTFSGWADENSDYIRKTLFGGKSEEDMNIFENFAVGINAVGKGVNDAIASLTGLDFAKMASGVKDFGTTFDENSKYLKNFREDLNNIIDSYKNLKESIIENRDAKLLEISETEGYLESLDRIVDENGKVKGGYEELGEYILNDFSEAFGEQYELIDGVIYKNGEAIGSYSEFRSAIDENIKKMKEEAEQAAKIELFEQAYKQRIKLEQELKAAKLENEKAEIALIEASEKGMDTTSKEFKQLSQHYGETSRAYSELVDELNKNYGEITDYSIAAFSTLYNKLEEGNDLQAGYLQDLFTNDLTSWEKIFNTLDSDQKLLMLQMTSTAETWNPKLAQTWQDMANKMPEKFGSAFDEVSNKMYSNFNSINTAIVKSDIPQNIGNLGVNATDRFQKDFNIDSIVTTKIQGASNTMYSNSYLVDNASNDLANVVKNNLNNIDTETPGKQSVWGFANGITAATAGTTFKNALSNLANNVLFGIKDKLGIHSPSTVMRDEIGRFIPLGLAKGIDMEADSVSKSMQDLTDRIRVDQQDFEFYNDGNLVSSINGKINAQTAVALNDNTLQNMTNATYEAMSRALIDNNEDYNPQFNVYIGNDKVYSGFGNYQNNESNRYGVKV